MGSQVKNCGSRRFPLSILLLLPFATKSEATTSPKKLIQWDGADDEQEFEIRGTLKNVQRARISPTGIHNRFQFPLNPLSAVLLSDGEKNLETNNVSSFSPFAICSCSNLISLFLLSRLLSQFSIALALYLNLSYFFSRSFSTLPCQRIFFPIGMSGFSSFYLHCYVMGFFFIHVQNRKRPCPVL